MNKAPTLVTSWMVGVRKTEEKQIGGKNKYFMFGHVEIKVPLSSGRNKLSNIQIYRLEEIWLGYMNLGLIWIQD